MTQRTDGQLKDYDTELSLITDEVRTLVSSLSDSQVSWRPASDRWSIGDCLTHLTLVGQLYLPTLDDGIRKARETGALGQGPFRYRWLDRLMIRSTEPPPKRRFKTPRLFRPRGSQYRTSEVLVSFATMQSSLGERLLAADGLDLRRSRIPSPRRELHHTESRCRVRPVGCARAAPRLAGTARP